MSSNRCPRIISTQVLTICGLTSVGLAVSATPSGRIHGDPSRTTNPIKGTIDTSGFVRRFGGGEIDGIELGKKRAKKP
jgi:pyruvate-formate lyase